MLHLATSCVALLSGSATIPRILPYSTAVFAMENNAMGAGMGTSGLVGQFGAWAAMGEAGFAPITTLLLILLMHFILPAGLTLLISELFRKKNWIKSGDMQLQL